MKQFSLIVFAFVFEGLALWGIGENTALRIRYDRFMKYPVSEKKRGYEKQRSQTGYKRGNQISKSGLVV